MTTTKGMVLSRRKNPEVLTPMEQRIFDLRACGYSYRVIAEKMGGRWTAKNIGSKLKIVREKMACQ